MHVRFTEREYESLTKKFQKTISNQLSHYVRNVLLERPIIIKYRNESMDTVMEELILLREELNAIGNNFNQAVKKLHALKQIPEFRQWIATSEGIYDLLNSRTNHIQQRISQMSDKWLQG